MSKKRKQHSVQFKAKVALAALQNEETVALLASRSDVHLTMVSAWKRQLIDSAAELFHKNFKSRENRWKGHSMWSDPLRSRSLDCQNQGIPRGGMGKPAAAQQFA